MPEPGIAPSDVYGTEKRRPHRPIDCHTRKARRPAIVVIVISRYARAHTYVAARQRDIVIPYFCVRKARQIARSRLEIPFSISRGDTSRITIGNCNIAGRKTLGGTRRHVSLSIRRKRRYVKIWLAELRFQ